MQVVWNKQALKQLDETLMYCRETFGAKTTRNFYTRMMNYCDTLAAHPLIGEQELLLEDFKLDFRGIIVHKYFKLIYYTKAETIHIADLWDLRRDPESLMKRIKNKRKS